MSRKRTVRLDELGRDERQLYLALIRANKAAAAARALENVNEAADPQTDGLAVPTPPTKTSRATRGR
jgi:hypothetical protein